MKCGAAAVSQLDEDFPQPGNPNAVIDNGLKRPQTASVNVEGTRSSFGFQICLKSFSGRGGLYFYSDPVQRSVTLFGVFRGRRTSDASRYMFWGKKPRPYGLFIYFFSFLSLDFSVFADRDELSRTEQLRNGFEQTRSLPESSSPDNFDFLVLLHRCRSRTVPHVSRQPRNYGKRRGTKARGENSALRETKNKKLQTKN